MAVPDFMETHAAAIVSAGVESELYVVESWDSLEHKPAYLLAIIPKESTMEGLKRVIPVAVMMETPGPERYWLAEPSGEEGYRKPDGTIFNPTSKGH